MNDQTLQKLKQMKFLGMAMAFNTTLEDGRMASMTADEMVAFMVESEWDYRNNRRIERHITQARFRYKANIENLDFATDRNLDKNQIMRFADCNFIDKSETIIITGSTGIGKSYVASAIGNQACMLGYKVLYANTTKLFARLKMSKADGSYIKEIARIEKQDLLILDDFGIQPFDNQADLRSWRLLKTVMANDLRSSLHNSRSYNGMRLLEKILLQMLYWTASYIRHIVLNSQVNQ